MPKSSVKMEAMILVSPYFIERKTIPLVAIIKLEVFENLKRESEKLQ
jgi:hypothetical protein